MSHKTNLLAEGHLARSMHGESEELGIPMIVCNLDSKNYSGWKYRAFFISRYFSVLLSAYCLNGQGCFADTTKRITQSLPLLVNLQLTPETHILLEYYTVILYLRVVAYCLYPADQTNRVPAERGAYGGHKKLV